MRLPLLCTALLAAAAPAAAQLPPPGADWVVSAKYSNYFAGFDQCAFEAVQTVFARKPDGCNPTPGGLTVSQRESWTSGACGATEPVTAVATYFSGMACEGEPTREVPRLLPSPCGFNDKQEYENEFCYGALPDGLNPTLPEGMARLQVLAALHNGDPECGDDSFFMYQAQALDVCMRRSQADGSVLSEMWSAVKDNTAVLIRVWVGDACIDKPVNTAEAPVGMCIPFSETSYIRGLSISAPSPFPEPTPSPQPSSCPTPEPMYMSTGRRGRVRLDVNGVVTVRTELRPETSFVSYFLDGALTMTTYPTEDLQFAPGSQLLFMDEGRWKEKGDERYVLMRVLGSGYDPSTRAAYATGIRLNTQTDAVFAGLMNLIEAAEGALPLAVGQAFDVNHVVIYSVVPQA